jgi:hypothetical protein
MTAYVVIVAQRPPADPFAAKYVEADSAEEAGQKTGGHFVHVYEDAGHDSVVHTETSNGVETKYPLLIEDRPSA